MLQSTTLDLSALLEGTMPVLNPGKLLDLSGVEGATPEYESTLKAAVEKFMADFQAAAHATFSKMASQLKDEKKTKGASTRASGRSAGWGRQMARLSQRSSRLPSRRLWHHPSLRSQRLLARHQTCGGGRGRRGWDSGRGHASKEDAHGATQE